MENFFGHLKEEVIRHTQLHTVVQSKEVIADYIHFYNSERIQLKTKLALLFKRCQFTYLQALLGHASLDMVQHYAQMVGSISCAGPQPGRNKPAAMERITNALAVELRLVYIRLPPHVYLNCGQLMILRTRCFIQQLLRIITIPIISPTAVYTIQHSNIESNGQHQMQQGVFKVRIVLRAFPISTRNAQRTRRKTKNLRALRVPGG